MLCEAVLQDFTIERMYLTKIINQINSSSFLLSYSTDAEPVRYSTSFACARLLKHQLKMTEFMVGIEVKVLLWHDEVVCIESTERTVRLARGDAQRTITLMMETHFRQACEVLRARKQDIYFDGTYLYSFEGDVGREVQSAESVSADNRFRVVKCTAYNLNRMSTMKDQATRTCLAYVAKNSQYAISPPIWKYANVSVREKLQDRDNELSGISNIDLYAEHRPSMMFVITAAKTIAQAFGYKSIAPLRIPQLMVQYNTVNLPNLPTEVLKTTYINYITPAVMLGWLMGLLARSTTFEQMLAVRRLLKYFTTKGLLHPANVDIGFVFKEGKSLEDVQLLTIEQLKSMTE